MSTSESNSAAQQLGSLVNRNIALPIEAILLVSGVVGLVVSSPTITIWMLAIWVVLALAYVIVAIRRLVRAVRSQEENRKLLPADSPTKGIKGKAYHFDVIAIGFASAMGLTSAIAVSVGSLDGIFAQTLAPAGIVLSWMLLQFGFTRLYADTWFRNDDGGGIEFPGTEEPGLTEFTYFAFAVGSALQGPNLTTSRMRMLVTIHSAISFLYGTVLIAFTVSTIPTG